MKPVLLVGNRGDSELEAIAEGLDALAHPWLYLGVDDRLELSLHGAQARWTWPGGLEVVVDLGQASRDAWPFGCVFLRGLLPPARFPEDSTYWTRELARNEAFWDGEVVALKVAYLLHMERCGVRVVNPVSTAIRATNKIAQLLELAAAGARVPRTLVTQHGPSVVELGDERGLIYKAVGGSSYVHRLVRADLHDERLATLARAPVTFQELCGDTDVRAFVFDGELLGAFLIVSDRLVDPRRQVDAVRETEIAPALLAKLRDAMACSGLAFAGIDIRVAAADPRDGHVLEMNSAPMFTTFSARAGIPIGRRLAERLAAAARDS